VLAGAAIELVADPSSRPVRLATALWLLAFEDQKCVVVFRPRDPLPRDPSLRCRGNSRCDLWSTVESLAVYVAREYTGCWRRASGDVGSGGYGNT